MFTIDGFVFTLLALARFGFNTWLCVDGREATLSSLAALLLDW